MSSGAFVSIHGGKFGLGHDNSLVDGNGVPILPSATNPMSLTEFSDDFFGDALLTNWNGRVGSDGQVVTPTILVGAAGGAVRLVTGDDATTTMAVNGVQLESALNWYAAQGNLVFETRVKLSAITDIALFVGFTDQVAALEMPIHSAASANTITTNATDAVGVFFDTEMTTDTLWCAGVKNDVDATHDDSGIVPVAAAYNKIRIEVDVNGAARIYIDDDLVSEITAAVTTSVGLTPVVAAFSRGAASRNVDVDYIYCRQNR
jgi:hypothetical protein